MSEVLALVAPGRPLREGLDRVLQAKRGVLLVLGDDPAVLSICSGGFLLDAEFSPQRMSELAKMDGAIVLARDAGRIARANVHLMPRASIPTSETGTRHRTAERVARSIDVPVITISQAMSTIAVYRHDRKHILQPTARLVDRASQALSTLQRFRSRFDLASTALFMLEVEDTVSVRDVAAVLQPGEMITRIADEIASYLVELGEDGRLIRLQMDELRFGVDDALNLVIRDYVDRFFGSGSPGSPSPKATDGACLGSRELAEERTAAARAALHDLTSDELLDPMLVAAALGPTIAALGLDAPLEARGYRLLHRLPRVSNVIIERIVDQFSTLPRIMQASLADLEKVGGVGEAKARSVRDGLTRLVEATILERYG